MALGGAVASGESIKIDAVGSRRVHKVHKIDEQFLRAFDSKGRNHKGAAGPRLAHLVPQQARAACG